MLIHLGNNEFVDIQQCVAIFNLATIDIESKNRIMKYIPARHRSGLRAAVLTTTGTWLGSTLSTEALAQRGVQQSFPRAVYLRPPSQRGKKRKAITS